MKVRDLIAQLSECDLDSEIIMQGDPEGNFYTYLAGADPDNIVDADHKVWTLEEAQQDEDEVWLELDPLPRVVVLYPDRNL